MTSKALYLLCFLALVGQLSSFPWPQQGNSKIRNGFVFSLMFLSDTVYLIPLYFCNYHAHFDLLPRSV